MKSTVLFVLLFAGLSCDKTPPVAKAPEPIKTAVVAEPAKPVEPLPPATDVGKMLTRLDADIAFRTKKAESGGGWLHYEALAGAHLARARLTGNVDEYVAAGRAFDKAFEVAPKDSGPFFGRAHYNYTIHRIAEVEADLVRDEKRLLRKVEDEAQTVGMRGDLALQMADLDKARQHYTHAMELRPSLAAVARLAFLDLKTGNPDAARKGYEDAAARAKSDKAQLAWAQLHRGIVELEVGNVAEALRWYQMANASFSGWYLIEEHIAEAKLLLGDADGAIALYESIVARTPNGEFMGALGEAWQAKGDEAKAKEWIDKATAAFERDIAKLPSAASGHALEFYLAHDTKRALELARENVKLRANHDARMQLAQAELANGDAEAARAALAPVVGSAWAAPDFLATVAIAYAGVDEKVAAQARQAASKIDPDAVEELRQGLGLAQ